MSPNAASVVSRWRSAWPTSVASRSCSLSQQIDRDRPGVVGVQELLALLTQLGEAFALA